MNGSEVFQALKNFHEVDVFLQKNYAWPLRKLKLIFYHTFPVREGGENSESDKTLSLRLASWYSPSSVSLFFCPPTFPVVLGYFVACCRALLRSLSRFFSLLLCPFFRVLSFSCWRSSLLLLCHFCRALSCFRFSQNLSWLFLATSSDSGALSRCGLLKPCLLELGFTLDCRHNKR